MSVNSSPDPVGEERRDLSPAGIGFRDLIDEVLALLERPEAISSETVAEVRALVRDAKARFDEHRGRVHGLNQILTVLSLIDVEPDPSELRRLILDTVRHQRPN